MRDQGWSKGMQARGHLGRDAVASRVVYLLAISAVIALSPMTVMRFITGDTLIAVLDIGIIVLFVGIAACRRLLGWAQWQGVAVAVSAILIALGMIAFRSMDSALWMFPSLITLFFVLRPRTALYSGLVVAALAGVVGGMNYTPVETATFVITLVLVDVFVFVFTSQLAAMQQRLDALASQDPLTGLANRRKLEEDFPAAVVDGPTGLLVVDLDHFKAINDVHGHDVGDAVLRRVGNTLRGGVRRSDRVYRYGGEEFVLLLEDSDAAASAAVAESLRVAIAREATGDHGPVTASIGVTQCGRGEVFDACFARADAALYRAKAAGRDRVVVDRA